MMLYKQYDWAREKYPIVGKLTKTNQEEYVTGSNDSRSGRNKTVRKVIYVDEENNKFIKMFNYWWKYPEQIEG